jgi:hypothetical protein
MEGLESFLRGTLVPKNPEEELFIMIKDKKLPGGGAYFYSFMTPKEMRLSRTSTIYCVGLKSDMKLSDEYKFAVPASFRKEGRNRFGEAHFRAMYQFSSTAELVRLEVSWDLTVESQLPQTGLGGVASLLWRRDLPLEELEAFLRSHLQPKAPGFRLFFQVHDGFNTHDFFGLGTPDELQLTAQSRIVVKAEDRMDLSWERFEGQVRSLYPQSFHRYWRLCVLGQQRSPYAQNLLAAFEASKWSIPVFVERDEQTTRLRKGHGPNQLLAFDHVSTLSFVRYDIDMGAEYEF